MSPINIRKNVIVWLNKNQEVEFYLPDRHFGRPGDSCFRFVDAEIDINQLVIKFDENIVFTILGKFKFEIVDESLEISKFELLKFEQKRIPNQHARRFNGKKPQVEHVVEEYDDGVLRFIPYSKYLN